MLEFDSKETEIYYYHTLKKHNIMHVGWNKGVIITKEIIDEFVQALFDETNYVQVENVPFEEFP